MRCESLELVKEKILRACERSGRSVSDVKLLGASKTVPAERLREFYECGLHVFGENRVQEFLKKYEELESFDIEWHFIGRLQSNKVKYIIDKVVLIHSLDRESLAKEIQKRAERLGRVQEVLVEVNVGNEESKGGVKTEQLEEFISRVLELKNLKVIGLMCIPPYMENPEDVRPFFGRLRDLRDKLGTRLGIPLGELSMGMSHDFEVAIEEGATIVRVGSLLFGERG